RPSIHPALWLMVAAIGLHVTGRVPSTVVGALMGLGAGWWIFLHTMMFRHFLCVSPHRWRCWPTLATALIASACPAPLSMRMALVTVLLVVGIVAVGPALHRPWMARS